MTPGAGMPALDSDLKELAAQALRRFGRLALRVSGTSMLPAVRPSDVLHVRQCPIFQATPGDIVLFLRERRLYAHRVVARRGSTVVTQGDTIAEPDLAVSPAEFLGRVEHIARRGALLLPPRSATFGAGLFRHSALARRIYGRALARTRAPA